MKHPIASLNYMGRMLVPSIAVYYLREKYRQTRDERFASAIDACGGEMKEIIRDCYSVVAPERQEKLVNDLEALVKQAKTLD